jgi:alcohol/geraniol dehydrogenase (NADP+)
MPLVYAAKAAGAKLEPMEVRPGGPLGADEVEIKVESCGICHSDLSMLENHWGMTTYPYVGGHEVVGTIAAMGPNVAHLKVGQRVGLGWYSRSCLNCQQCVGGDQNLCGTAEGTIVGRHGGFADTVRAQARWATPIPEGIDPRSAGPLFCGGITVFNPLVQFGVKPTDRVGVIGIGGLGHLAIRFLRAWGCDVTAFSSSTDKEPEARAMGAHHFVNSKDSAALAKIAGHFDFILNTVNVSMDWGAYINALAPKGRLHVVGAVDQPIPVGAFPMLIGQRSLSGSPLGSPATVSTMLQFAGRHGIAPTCEYFPFTRINDALDRLRSGRARYRIVLTHS